jgi:solute carrier family 25 phosphate transporter 23/24/25/41
MIPSRMQCETVAGGLHGNRLMFATAHKMWTTEGIKSFYRGVGPGLIGMAPYAAIDLGTFEYLKNYIIDRNIELHGLHEDDARPSAITTAMVGGFTGSLGATVVYPINLLRTRLQTQGTVLHPRTYNGFWDVAKVTLEGEGVRGMFKGLLPNLLKVVPAVSIVSISIPPRR